MLPSADQPATNAMFDNCYRNCRVIHDIIAYVDGETAALEIFGRQPIAYQIINLIKTGDFLEETRRWREVFADSWQKLVEENKVVKAEDNPTERSIAELVSIYDTTNTMIRALENRFITILLRQRHEAAR